MWRLEPDAIQVLKKNSIGKRFIGMLIPKKRISVLLFHCLFLSWYLPAILSKELDSSQFQKLCGEVQSFSRSEAKKKNLLSFCMRTRNKQLAGLGFFLLGYVEFQNERFEESSAYLNKASAYNVPIEDYLHYYRAESLHRSHHQTEAKQELNVFLSRYPDSPFRSKVLGLYRQTCLDSNDPQAVLDSLKFSANVAEDPEALYFAACAQDILGQPSLAIEHFRRLYFLFPLSIRAGSVAQKISSLSRPDFDLMVGVPDEWKAARIERLYLAKKYSEALKDLQAVLQSDSSLGRTPQYFLWEGICLFGTGRYTEAIERLKSIQNLNSDLQAQACFTIAEAYRKMDNAESFGNAVDELGEKYPASKWFEESLFSLGNYNLVNRDLKGALETYEKLVDSFPNGSHSADAHWRTGWLYYRRNEYGRALEKFLEHPLRFSESPHITSAIYWAARCKEKLGQIDDAIPIYYQLQRRSPNSYYGQLAKKRLPQGMTAMAQHVSPPVGKVLDTLKQKSSDPEGLDWAQIQHQTPESWPRVKALTTILLFDLAARELQRKEIYGESSSLDFRVARLYYQGKDYRSAIVGLRRLIPNYQDVSFETLPRSVWEMFYPADFVSVIMRESERQNVDPYWVLSLIRQESAFNPGAVSSANAYGLMQLLPTTARSVSREMKLRSPATSHLQDPNLNIRLGTRYFADLLKKFGGQMEMALASYNAGPERVQEWVNEGGYGDNAEFVETIPFSETRNYVKVISRGYWFYQRLYSKEGTMKPVGEHKGNGSRKK